MAKADKNSQTQMSEDQLQDLVIETDTGGRHPGKYPSMLLIGTAFLWALFQLWIASPLPFVLEILVLNSTQTRFIHLTFALFIAFLAYPAFKSSPRDKIPVLDWIFAGLAAYACLYLFIFYEALSARTGLPTNVVAEMCQLFKEGELSVGQFFTMLPRILYDDVVIAAVGIILLLEATRRTLGPPLMVIALIFLLYTFAGPYMPEVIAHKGQSLNKVASHQWLTTEGVFGIAVGVSTSFVFLFVLFGALLDKAGAGNYFIKVAFSLLGHLKGGPAKAAVLSSGLTGLISGSSIANVVTTGTFTVPLMRRVGFSREKAGAVEVASSVNGQIMPPVMGAAAFLMVEYANIPYIDVVKHAFLPAIISYIALLYIVHLEAVKADMQTFDKPTNRSLKMSLVLSGIIISSIIIVAYISYKIILVIKSVAGDAGAPWVIIPLLLGVYAFTLWYAAKHPELEKDDPNAPMVQMPETGPTVKTGLHYLLPIIVLVWFLMIERKSPGLSAFYATAFMIFILLTQHPIKAFFRKSGEYKEKFKLGVAELFEGMVAGSRNMVGIGVATAAAGIVVGSVSLTGVGQVLTELVELIAGGSLVMILLFTALICIILGMGLPTTANYIVVASLMAKVIEDLGAQNGLIVPAIAIHLFVFYFGIMADVTPPVGLASFAAAAVSGGDPIKTGIQAFLYSTRTVILPFLFIFNTELLLIGVDSFFHAAWVFIISTLAILLFAASTQGFFLTKSKLAESIALLLVSFTLFRPGFWMDMFVPPYDRQDPTMLAEILDKQPEGSNVRLFISGKTAQGKDKEFIAQIPIEGDADGATRIDNFGLWLAEQDGKVIIDDVMFNSPAQKAGIDIDLSIDQDFYYTIDHVGVPQAQPNKYWMYIPAVFVFIFVVFLQLGRRTDIKITNGAVKAAA